MSSIEVVEAKVDDMHGTVRHIDIAIRGDGRGTPGLAQRVAALEQFQAEIKKLVRWAIVGVMGLFGNLFWEIVQAYLERN